MAVCVTRQLMPLSIIETSIIIAKNRYEAKLFRIPVLKTWIEKTQQIIGSLEKVFLK